VTPQPSALKVGGLHVRYGQRDVLRGLDMRIGPGEIYGLLGPNGAGKTTLIRTICGRIRPHAGAIRIAGEPAGPNALRRIGLVPQELALYPHLTARENLETFGRLSGLSYTQTRDAVEWASQAAALTPRLHERIETLSGGWKRRVNIAASILHRPALLILDEPTVGVDIEARNGLHEVILQLSRTGMGVLLATHDLDQAESLCSVVGFLRQGVVSPQGSPRVLVGDTFGEQKEIILELRHPPTGEQSAILGRAGFVAHHGGLTWMMNGTESEHSAASLSEGLHRAGIATREVRFREPGLDSLFVHLSRGAVPNGAAAP
jgi:ABC-2 type transport system ATP-binding protein